MSGFSFTPSLQQWLAGSLYQTGGFDLAEFQRRAARLRIDYEDYRERRRIIYPHVSRAQIEANAKPVKLMTPEELIAAGAHLYVKG